MDFWQFMNNSPFLTFFLALILASVIKTPFWAFNRFMRHLNIRKAGWPPPHCDADGDFKPVKDADT